MHNNVSIEFFKFLSDFKVRAQRDSENPSLSKDFLEISIDYYSNIYSDYSLLHEDNHHVLLELNELNKSINKLQKRINSLSK